MRRKLLTFVLVVLAALATAGVAAATNGGLTPVTPASPNAKHIVTAYWVVVFFTAVIFFLVEGLLVVFIWKYRSRGRPRTVEGPQVHGQTRLEIIWTVIPVIILAVIAAVVFALLPKISDAPASTNPIHITLEGHQFYWQFDYTDTPNKARSINTLYVPVGAVVDLKVVSPDVIHSWWIPALGGKIQAIPGHPNDTWFRADRAGTFPGQCAELCGVYHASMTARVVAESQAEYDAYVNSKAATTIGKQEWNGVCATCHGNLGQGGYGPSIASNPTIIQPAGLVRILRYGFNGPIGAMPPVGDTWNAAQIHALIAYVRHHVYTGTTTG
ncbi:MAG TPA: cytochrome c oxidase subunit II [Gaiellaceae bacterium]